MRMPSKQFLLGCACALALSLAGCSADPAASTGQAGAQGGEAQEEQEVEEVPALSATIDDAFLIRENALEEMLAVDATVTNGSDAPIKLYSNVSLSDDVPEMHSNSTVYCSWGDTYLPNGELDAANPDYVESTLKYDYEEDVLGPGQTATVRFVFDLDYRSLPTLDADYAGYHYYGSQEDPFTFRIESPILPSDYEPDSESEVLDGDDFDTEVVAEQSFDYDELEVHGVANPYLITSSSWGTAEDANGDELVMVGFGISNGGSEAVSFGEDFRVTAEQDGQELELVEDCDWSIFGDDYQYDYYTPEAGDKERRLEPGGFVDAEVGEGGHINAHAVFKLVNSKDPVELRVYMATDSSYPVFTLTRDV